MSGTSAGAAKRKRCKCGAFTHLGDCPKPKGLPKGTKLRAGITRAPHTKAPHTKAPHTKRPHTKAPHTKRPHTKKAHTKRPHTKAFHHKAFHHKAFHHKNRPHRDLMERVWEKIDQRGPDECWPWTGTCNKQGYGLIGSVERKTLFVHRLVNDTPEGMETRHTCDNPPCCNPGHLLTGTKLQNMDDMKVRGRSRKGKANPLVAGEKSSRAKLTQAQVDAIRDDPRPSTHLAPEYGVSSGTIRKIRRGERW